VRLLRDVGQMSRWMAWADVAVGAAGISSWERCLVGLPSLVVILADNQQAVAEHLAEHFGAMDAMQGQTPAGPAVPFQGGPAQATPTGIAPAGEAALAGQAQGVA